MGPWFAAKNANVTVPYALVQLPSLCHLPRVSHQSSLMANDKGDNEVKPEAVHRSPGIYLAAEENQTDGSCESSHRLKWVSLF